ncbi:MAG TPA: SusD/RagB family nutrient-binding outer membrane lipoprotein [Gemmatimonadaceae bacterium]
MHSIYRNGRLGLAAAGLLVGAVACNPDSLTNMNAHNPNAPTKVPVEKIFPAGVSSAVGLVEGSSMQLYFTELWSQHIAEYQYPDDDQYAIRPTTIDGYWQSFYNGGLQDFEQILRQSQGKPDQAGPALVMKSWTFQAATDLWGDIPYTEANQGDLGNITPKYDTQQTIYAGLLADLKTAATTMGTANPYGYADLIYSGNNTKWKRFANSLRARVAIHLSKADPAKAASEIAAAYAAGGFTSNADDALLKWPGDGVNDAPYYTTFKTRDDHRLSKTLVDTLIALNDPRLAVYARPTQAWTADSVGCGCAKYAGLPNGLTAGAAGALGRVTSRVGTYFSQKTTPSVLMSNAEYQFILAEAAHRGWITGGDAAAATFYNAGITASMATYGITGAAVTAYLAQPAVAYNPATAQAQISLQKWIALYAQGLEAWNEYRRTGYPVLQPADQAKTTPRIVPRRLEYPQSEQSFNNGNLQAAITRQSGASMTNRFFWDKP